MTRHKCFVCGAWRNGYCIKVTPLTQASIEAVLRAQGRDTEVTMGGHVCRETCYTDEMVERRRRDHSFDSTECSWVGVDEAPLPPARAYLAVSGTGEKRITAQLHTGPTLSTGSRYNRGSGAR